MYVQVCITLTNMNDYLFGYAWLLSVDGSGTNSTVSSSTATSLRTVSRDQLGRCVIVDAIIDEDPHADLAAVTAVGISALLASGHEVSKLNARQLIDSGETETAWQRASMQINDLPTRTSWRPLQGDAWCAYTRIGQHQIRVGGQGVPFSDVNLTKVSLSDRNATGFGLSQC